VARGLQLLPGHLRSGTGTPPPPSSSSSSSSKDSASLQPAVRQSGCVCLSGPVYSAWRQQQQQPTVCWQQLPASHTHGWEVCDTTGSRKVPFHHTHPAAADNGVKSNDFAGDDVDRAGVGPLLLPCRCNTGRPRRLARV
jgi:hypothetical protein